MLRQTPSKSAKQAQQYFANCVSKDTRYYVEGQEEPGKWGGKGAELLGLKGDVEQLAFNRLTENRHPITGEKLTPRDKANREVGRDFTFDCPKSVSIVYGITQDPRIVAAMERAANKTLEIIEANMHTRVRLDGVKDGIRRTGNIVWAAFNHKTARPEGDIPDPHLHRHMYIFNCTYDPVEKRFKADMFRPICDELDKYQGIYHNFLAQELQVLGFKTVKRGIAFEIEGVPDSAIQRFSKRTKKINRVKAELGITDPKAAAKLGAATRQAKKSDLNMNQLRQHWIGSMPASEYQAILEVIRASRTPVREPKVGATRVAGVPPTPLAAMSGKAASRPSAITKEEELAIAYALLHCFEKASVVRQSKFLATVLEFAVGHADLARIEASVNSRPDLIRRTINGQMLLTTPEILKEEKAIVHWTKAGMRAVAPLVSRSWKVPEWFSTEQRAAMHHILTSPDRITGVQGLAGAGKTTLMKEAIRIMEENGHKVLILTPRARTAYETLPSEGFKRSETVSQLLNNETLQRTFAGGVLWIDEAGQLSSRDMFKLVRVSEAYGYRLVLSGDTRQHGPVERGDSLKILQDHADLQLIKMGKIQRQTGRYREAVEHIAEGRIVEGYKILDSLNWICEVSNEDRHKHLARDYLASLREGKTALVISPTRRECRQVTDTIREERMNAGEITEEHVLSTLREIDLSEAQRRDARTYRPGFIIEMLKSAPGFAPGERLEVMTVGHHPESGLTVRRENGEEVPLPVHRYGNRFQVYEKEEIAIGPGEPVLFTKNGWSIDDKFRLHNGGLRTIESFTPRGDLVLDSGVVISKDFAHLSYGYVTTSHASQGKTVDRVFIAESSDSFGAASMQQFNVSVTRGREFCRIYTDDKEDLRDAVQINSLRIAALDLVNDEVNRARDHEEELRRAQQSAEARMPPEPPHSSLRNRLGKEKRVPELQFVRSRAPEIETQLITF